MDLICLVSKRYFAKCALVSTVPGAKDAVNRSISISNPPFARFCAIFAFRLSRSNKALSKADFSGS